MCEKISGRSVEVAMVLQACGDHHGPLKCGDDDRSTVAPLAHRQCGVHAGDQPVDVRLEEVGYGCRQRGWQSAAFGAQHAAQADALGLYERGSVDSRKRPQARIEIVGIRGCYAQSLEEPCSIARDECQSQILLLAKIVVNAGAFDAELVCQLTKTDRMIAARANRHFGGVQQFFRHPGHAQSPNRSSIYR